MKISVKYQLNNLNNEDIKWYLAEEKLWITKYNEYAEIEKSIENSLGSFNWLYEINDTVLFNKKDKRIVYIGRASGKGTPLEVMKGRISKGHDHFKEGYSYEIIATQTNKLANQGAEEFFILGYEEMGIQLENITPSLSYRKDRVDKTMNKIEAFFEDLF